MRARKTICGVCAEKLPDSVIYTGLCFRHAEKEEQTLKKTLFRCTLVGAVLAVVFFITINIMQLRSTGYFYGTDAAFRIYRFFVTMPYHIYGTIGAVLFFLPFGLRLDASFSPGSETKSIVAEGRGSDWKIQTQHDSSPTSTYEGDGLISIVRCIVGILLAPIFIAVKLIRLRRLRKYIEAEKSA